MARVRNSHDIETTVTTGPAGIGLLGFLGLLFVGLKLCGVIDWSWWLVLLPFYGGLALVLAILAIVGIISLIAYALTR